MRHADSRTGAPRSQRKAAAHWWLGALLFLASLAVIMVSRFAVGHGPLATVRQDWADLLVPCVAAGFLSVMAARIALEDLRRMMIRDLDTVLVAIGALVFITSGPAAHGPAATHVSMIGMALLSAVSVVVALAAFSFLYGRLRGMEALGFGDVKLLGASALWLGVTGVAMQVLLASLAALVFAALRARRLNRPLRRTGRLPFAAFLAPALVLVFALNAGINDGSGWMQW